MIISHLNMMTNNCQKINLNIYKKEKINRFKSKVKKRNLKKIIYKIKK